MTIEPIEGMNHDLQPMTLSQIANNSLNLNGRYLTTLLYVVTVNPVQTIAK